MTGSDRARHPFVIVAELLFALLFLAAGPFIFTRGRQWQRVLWVTGVVYGVAVALATAWVQPRLEWRTSVSEQEAVGVWGSGQNRLTLRSDGIWVHGSERGAWQLKTPSVVLLPSPPPGFENPRFIRFSGRLRLLPNYGDPDDWDGELGFERESGAVAP